MISAAICRRVVISCVILLLSCSPYIRSQRLAQARATNSPITQLPTLQGEAALNYLKRQNNFDSLQAAMHKARQEMNSAEFSLTSNITQQAYLKASNHGMTDIFGQSIAVSGDTVIVGAPLEDPDILNINTYDSGAAYVFVRNGSTWSQQAYLKASNFSVSDNFGISVSISGDTVVVGANREDSNATGVNGDESNNSATNAGAAYVFTRNGTTWSQQAYLKASNTQAIDDFGFSVATDGDTIVVGATDEDSNATGVNGNQANNSASRSGAAYVFTRNGTAWSQQAYLKASNTGVGDIFGSSVAISGNTLVVGANREDSNALGVNGDGTDNSASDSGAVYVFVRDVTTWSQQAYLKASNTGMDDRFGLSLAVSGETIVVGAPLEASSSTGVNSTPNENTPFAGAAYAFIRSGVTWSQQAYLKASNTGPDSFGVSVAVLGDTIVVGAPGESSNSTGVDSVPNENALAAGAAYVFMRTGTTWSQQNYVKASNPETGDNFGASVSVSSSIVAIGAIGEDSNAIGVNGNELDNTAMDVGASYVFNIPCEVTSLTPNSEAIGANGGTFTFAVNASACAWTAVSQVPWLTVTANASGIGNLVVSYNVSVNLGATRTGLITVNNQTYSVTQATSDTTQDTDGDGIPDSVEIAEGRNLLLKDNDIFSNNRLFVMQQYRDFLGREGDAGGITNWVNALNANVLTRAQVIESFFNSAEFQNTGAPIVRLYFACFLRIPDYAGLQNWIIAYRGGMPLETIANFFVTSPEFLQTYGALDNTAFVTLVYNNVLGRAPDPIGLANWVNALNNGMPRGTMMVNFSESQEYKNRIGNSVYVTMMYVGMLRRSPDQTGFNNWVAFLNQGNSGLALINGFITAQEYHNRFLP